MSQVHEYELLAAPYPAELSETINRRLEEGWSLCGSPFAHAGEVFKAVIHRNRTTNASVDRRVTENQSDKAAS